MKLEIRENMETKNVNYIALNCWQQVEVKAGIGVMHETCTSIEKYTKIDRLFEKI
jgi:hypothetical protein